MLSPRPWAALRENAASDLMRSRRFDGGRRGTGAPRPGLDRRRGRPGRRARRLTARPSVALGRALRSDGGSARGALHCPPRGIDCTLEVVDCRPSGMSSPRNAKSGCSSGTSSTWSPKSWCSSGINSTPHAMSSTRSASHWLSSGTHSTSTAIDSSLDAINAPLRGVDSTRDPVRSCWSAG